MTHQDITILYLTQNLLPDDWMKFQQEELLKAVGDTEIIIASRKPTIIGENCRNIIQTESPSLSNIYWQILKMCRMSDKEYIGICEDDSLYHEEHYQYRPKNGIFAYNLSHWSLQSWNSSVFGWRNRKGNYTMIAHRKDVIEALEERYEKYPKGTPEWCTGEIGREKHEKNMGVTVHKSEDFHTKIPVININHTTGMDPRANKKHKTLGGLLAVEVPYWGKSTELIKQFK